MGAKTERPTVPCDGCGASIWWGETANEARMPIDPKPELRIVVVEERQPLASGPRITLVQTYVPHWATCPARQQFKKPKQ